MGAHDCVMRINFPAAFSQIIDQLFAGFELAAGRLIAIEIAHQANAERNVVQIIAMHVSAVDLAPPAIANFDLAITGRGAIADDEMIREPILHSAHVPVVIIKHAGVALPGTAIVHNDKFPAIVRHWRPANFLNHRASQITVSLCRGS